MERKDWNIEIHYWIKEVLFPSFDKDGYIARLEKNLTQLEGILEKNPDIYRLWIEIFETEESFLDWYNSLSNRWAENGIPENYSKIDILLKLQTLDPELVERGINAFEGDKALFYRHLLKYNRYKTYYTNYKTIALFFPPDILSLYIDSIAYGPV